MSETAKAALHDAAKHAYETGLSGLFSNDDQRPKRYTHRVAGLTFDLSKLHITEELVQAAMPVAQASGFDGARCALQTGGIVNPSEGRPAIHAAMRAQPNELAALADTDLQAEVRSARHALGAFAAGFDLKNYDSLIHLGIGGSALGPDMLMRAFAGMGLAPKLDVHIVANIDAAALEPVLDACDPKRTLVVIVSKSFTTIETKTNAASVEAWMEAAGVANPKQRMIAVTASPDKARAAGLPDSQILAFPEAVGGRYSLWSAVSMPIVLAFGHKAFEQMLAGGSAMDTHFFAADFPANVPALAAMMDYVYVNALGAQSRATFAYDERLALLPDYLQQLETESNGKHVTAHGAHLDEKTSPVVWGGTGTDAQHAVFQLLHQGSHLVPVEFIAAIRPAHNRGVHHRLLLSNCLAQSAALMQGRTPEQAAQKLGAGKDDPTAIAKSFPGNRPSTTILMDSLTPENLGALIAFYEHRVFALATLLGINPFDQMGVELGKEMAGLLEPFIGEEAPGADAGLDASTCALLAHISAAMD